MPVPAVIRFAVLWHGPSRGDLPAMVARVDDMAGNLVAVHRTTLRPDGSGYIDKRMLGPVKGCSVHLTPAGDRFAVGEGIETALSVLQETGRSVWAALSTSGLRGLVLPRSVREIVITADNDPAGLSAAQAALERWRAQGRRVRIAKPPTPGTDFNDLLRGDAAG
jgi:hypothetical protein